MRYKILQIAFDRGPETFEADDLAIDDCLGCEV